METADDRRIDVLDHGYCRLVDSMGNDLSIVRAARVSYNADWRPEGDDETAPSDTKLIRYLLSNKHTSPFESVFFTFEVTAPIFVFRQWHRHRTGKYNEVSARYTALPEVFYVPSSDTIGKQSTSSKQARVLGLLSHDERMHTQISSDKIWMACTAAFKIYRELLERGVPRELARGVLPFFTYSRMFYSIDLHNLFHFLVLRLHEHAQYEIRVYAEAMLKLIEPIVPVAVQAFKEFNLEKKTTGVEG